MLCRYTKIISFAKNENFDCNGAILTMLQDCKASINFSDEVKKFDVKYKSMEYIENEPTILFRSTCDCLIINKTDRIDPINYDYTIPYWELLLPKMQHKKAIDFNSDALELRNIALEEVRNAFRMHEDNSNERNELGNLVKLRCGEAAECQHVIGLLRR